MAEPPSRHVSPSRAAAAIAVAAIADALQLPLTLSMVGGILPAETVDIVIDVATAAATIALLGFHWALLPTFLIEAVPLVDAVPTWTGCVLFVLWRRKKAEQLAR